MRVVGQPDPAVLDERVDQIRHRLASRPRLAHPVQVRPDRFPIMAEVPRDRGDRPSPPAQRVRLHFFLPEQQSANPRAAVTNTATNAGRRHAGRPILGGENDLAGMAKIS
jgi:hypothetical protein